MGTVRPQRVLPRRNLKEVILRDNTLPRIPKGAQPLIRADGASPLVKGICFAFEFLDNVRAQSKVTRMLLICFSVPQEPA